mmetsp:Transcript_7662/g.21337  ORF Transcript_7662/g.21337 Transcript_7662/m.21337 type:complete len:266 (-) Transcript_7662:130-927(-)
MSDLKQNLVSTRFKKLPMMINRPNCQEELKEPTYWIKEVQVVRDFAAHISGWCRIDLYAGNDGIYFSEFTFTPFACQSRIVFKPLVVGGLLLAVANGEIDPKSATSKFIENTIGDKSWVYVSMLSLNAGNTTGLQVQSFNAYPSPVDLFSAIKGMSTTVQDVLFLRCLEEARKIPVALCPFRCVIVIDRGKSLIAITACQSDFSWKNVESLHGFDKLVALEEKLSVWKWSGRSKVIRNSNRQKATASQKVFHSSGPVRSTFNSNN